MSNLPDELVTWIGIIGSLCSIVGFFLSYILPRIRGKLAPTWLLTAGYVLIPGGFMILALAIGNIFQDIGYVLFLAGLAGLVFLPFYIQHETEKRTNEEYRLIEDSLRGMLRFLHEVRDLTPEILDIKSRLHTACTDVMDDVAHHFSVDTNSHCSCCIKLFKEPNEEKFRTVTTFCRDRPASRSVRGEKDGEEIFTTGPENTAFFKILYGNDDSFFSNNLARDKEYRNQRSGWAERYKATAVTAIKGLPIYTDQDDEAVDGLMGFLCVDTDKTGVLNEEKSVALLNCIAGTMYLPLHYFKSVEKRNHQSPLEEGGGSTV